MQANCHKTYQSMLAERTVGPLVLGFGEGNCACEEITGCLEGVVGWAGGDLMLEILLIGKFCRSRGGMLCTAATERVRGVVTRGVVLSRGVVALGVVTGRGAICGAAEYSAE